MSVTWCAPVGLDGPGACRLLQRDGTMTSSSVLGRKHGPSNTFMRRVMTICKRSTSSVYHSTAAVYSRLSSSSPVTSHDQNESPVRVIAASGNISSIDLMTWFSYWSSAMPV